MPILAIGQAISCRGRMREMKRRDSGIGIKNQAFLVNDKCDSLFSSLHLLYCSESLFPSLHLLCKKDLCPLLRRLRADCSPLSPIFLYTICFCSGCDSLSSSLHLLCIESLFPSLHLLCKKDLCPHLRIRRAVRCLQDSNFSISENMTLLQAKYKVHQQQKMTILDHNRGLEV
ncbi:hypothetical protein KP509_16G058900 [Ceratopteris richardii]|uniref:Uncharacterized protein n=1 Tax=Ceratopteris richardii TaxID=49495 RepID=A0A8T2T2U7_CERRI|nr:hypothetical protein KP509_16G058900 [Ceratopteris richardii]